MAMATDMRLRIAIEVSLAVVLSAAAGILSDRKAAAPIKNPNPVG
jgi:hypothetical protein